MLHEEVALYEKLTGEDGWHTPIIKIGAYLDGYEKGLSVLKDIKAEIEEIAEPDYVYHGCGSDEMICEMKNVFEIIDRYITGKE